MTATALNHRLTSAAARRAVMAVLLAFLLVGCYGPFSIFDLAETVAEYFTEGDFERDFEGDVDLGQKVLGSGAIP